jgi:hypothetical protein
MALSFSFDSVQHIEFGVGYETNGEEHFSLVPVDQDVQAALQEMATNTWRAMQDSDREPAEYEPSEKYASVEHVYMATDSDFAVRVNNLHTAANLPSNGDALDNPAALFCYFARMVDARSGRLTAVRRASQFKGIVKKRLVQFVTDALKLVEDNTFKLDEEFDFLVDRNRIHILHPSGFESIAELQGAIREAVPANVEIIQNDIPFVDFSNIAEYAASHTRAARHLASIRGQRETQNLSERLLHRACETHGVRMQRRVGRISILPGSEMDFLDILDRRMYALQLVEGSQERYRASSRRKVGN